MPLGALISAGGSLVRGLLGQSASNKQTKLQKEFAQKGIRWKVEDAKAAGIHPLAALGAQTHSFVPQQIGESMPAAMASAGQDIGRAVDAMRTPSERVDAYTEALRALQLERGQLENTFLASRIRLLNQPGSGPGLPDEFGDKLKPPERTTHLNTPFGSIRTNPGVSDAQTIEDRYGDVMQNVYGFLSWLTEAAPQHAGAVRRRIQDDLSRIRSRYAPDSSVRGPR